MRTRACKSGLTQALRTLQAGQRRMLPVRLRATPPAGDREAIFALQIHGLGEDGLITRFPQRYSSLEQLLAFRRPAELVSADDDGDGADRISCWGGGKLDLRLAPPDVIRCALAGLLSETEIARIESVRRDRPDCTLGELLRPLELKDDQLRALKPYVTDSSTCHSLWVIAEDGVRSSHRLYVRQEGDPENDMQEWTFVW